MSQTIGLHQHLSTIMDAMHWPDDGFVPVANEENRRLMEQLQQLIEAKEIRATHLKQLDQRLTLLADHHKNAQADVVQNLRLLDAHRQQRTTEHHLLKLAEHEKCTVRQLRKDEEGRMVAVAQQSVAIDESMQRMNAKIDGLGDDMQWMKSALLEWTRAIERDEQTNALIEKYCKDDKRRANALEVQRVAVQKTIEKRRQHLERVASERLSMEQVLQRTNNLYGKLHVERRNMIDTWRQAVQTLNARDRAIQQTIKDISTSHKQVERLKTELAQYKASFNEQILCNKDVEFDIAQLNEASSKVRQQLTDSMDSIQLNINEVITMKRELRSETNGLQQLRQKNRQTTIDCERLARAVIKSKEVVASLTAKVHAIESERNNGEQRLKHLNDLFESEEKSVDVVELEISRISQMLYRTTQILQQERNEYKNIESEIYTLETTIKAISCNFSNQEKELARQMEIQYDIHFKTMKLEYRIAKMQGAIDAVDPQLLDKCACLERIAAMTRDKHDHVKRQLASARDTERRLQSGLVKANAEHSALLERVRNGGADCDNGARTIAANRESLHERMVERSLLEMRIDQMRTMFNRQVGRFFSMEQHRIQLQAAIDERLAQLQCQQDILALKRKHLHAERDTLRADINERSGKIEAMKARFEMCHQLLGRNEDGSTVSVIQLRMETAQEKAMLLDRGSQLNERVLMAESDIKALENTLVLLNYSNDRYRQKVGNAQDNEKAIEEIQKLNNDYAKGLARLRAHRNDLEAKTKQLDEMRAQFALYERDMDEIARNRCESNDNLLKIHKELVDQNAKLERAKRELKIGKKAMARHVQNRDYVRIFEKTLKSKEIDNRNTCALQQLADMVDSVAGIGLVVPRLLYEKGLEIPMPSQYTVCKPAPRTRSRLSMRSSEADSDRHLQSASDDGLLSRLSERTFASTSSTMTDDRSSTKSMKSVKSNRLRQTSTTSPCNIQIEGQSICSDKTARS